MNSLVSGTLAVADKLIQALSRQAGNDASQLMIALFQPAQGLLPGRFIRHRRQRPIIFDAHEERFAL